MVFRKASSNTQFTFFQSLLDEKEDLVQERDAYKCKVHRLNHSMSALLKSNTYKLVIRTIDERTSRNINLFQTNFVYNSKVERSN